MEAFQGEKQLGIPVELTPNTGQPFPIITPAIREELARQGWDRIGIMSAIVSSDGEVGMLYHNPSEKTGVGALGPFGETRKELEGFHQTVYRGVVEELGVEEPANLGLHMHTADGWVINHWKNPQGANPPLDCLAVSFPLFLPDAARFDLERRLIGTEAISGIHFATPEEILDWPDDWMRPGTRQWMQELYDSGLLDPTNGNGTSEVAFDRYVATSHIPDDKLQG